jgi:hypothetical protein
MPFVYSNDALSNLRDTITRPRLSPYVMQTKGDLAEAIALYERNTLLSQELYGVLQALEIAFRGAVHRILTDGISASWYQRAPLRTAELNAVTEARKKIIRRTETVTPSRIVAELTFGFWTHLLSREYEKILWIPYLHKVFPHLFKPDRETLFRHFASIKTLRNRVAHHEPIIDRNLAKDYADIIGTIEWICPTTAAWVRASSAFPREYSK